MDLKETFIKEVVPILGSIMMGLTAWAFKSFAVWISAKAAEQKAVGKSTLFLTAVSKLTTITEACVHEAEVTAKEKYEEAAKDGVITAEEGAAIKNSVINKVLTTLGDQGQKELSSLLGISLPGLPGFVGSLVEKIVSRFDKPGVVVPVGIASVASGVAVPLDVTPGGLPPSR